MVVVFFFLRDAICGKKKITVLFKTWILVKFNKLFSTFIVIMWHLNSSTFLVIFWYWSESLSNYVQLFSLDALSCSMANCQYGCDVLKGEVRCRCPSPGLQLGPNGRTCIGTWSHVNSRFFSPKSFYPYSGCSSREFIRCIWSASYT